MSDDSNRDGREKGIGPASDPGGDVEVEIVSFGDDDPDAAAEAAELERDAARVDEALGAARQELAAVNERYLRLRADFENARKRLDRERDELRRTALAAPMLDLLPVIDNLERAAAAQGGLDDVRKGVELVARQFSEVLRRFGLAEIPAVGQPFDPRIHEAVARAESDEVAVPTVVEELQRGYWLNDRLLRPAMVKVAMPAEAAHRAAAPDSGDPEGGE